MDDVSFEVNRGETLGLVGESGCGKSTVGNVVMRLLPATAGELYFEGKDIFKAGKTERNKYCQEMQIVFQDPYSSLNPKKTIKAILSEPFQIQKIAFGSTLDKRIDELCDMVELQKSLLDRYPHELDGGMRQVVGIARALSINPKFIVCDEPVSSLDVSVQAKIINLLIDLQKKLDLSYLFISHEQIESIEEYQCYYRGIHPTPIGDVMMTGMNVPCRIGHAICMPGDVVLGTPNGVTFIPAHLAEHIACLAEKSHIRDAYGFEKIEEGKYSTAQVDQTWWPTDMMQDFMEWFHTSPKAKDFQYLDWTEELENAGKDIAKKPFDGLTGYTFE